MARLLRSLAAQVRPFMKSEGLKVNSFEEYQFNQVFAGRNWNAGDVGGGKTVLKSDNPFTRLLVSIVLH